MILGKRRALFLSATRTLVIFVHALLTLGCLLYAHNLRAMDNEQLRAAIEDNIQYRIWICARNAKFGLNSPKDPVAALAWQSLYVKRLPKSYPRKQALVDSFMESLDSEEQEQANILTNLFEKKYQLDFQFDEKALYQAYFSRDLVEDFTVSSVDKSEIPKNYNIQDWLADIKALDPMKAEQMERRFFDLQSISVYPIVYGKLNVMGPVRPKMIATNIEMDEDGYFVSSTADSKVYFDLAGYTAIHKNLDHRQLQYLGEIELHPSSLHSKTGLIGNVSPYHGSESVHIVLKKMDYDRVNVPMLYQAFVHLTVTQDGKFYTTGLSSGKYQLLIATNEKQFKRTVYIKNGEIKNVSTIRI